MRVRETQTLLDALEVFGGESTLVMDGFDDCIVGFLERFGLPEPILVYDREKVIRKLMDNGIETYEEAEEFYNFNQLGSWLGEGTPAFLRVWTDES
jgi:hypothetical protein